MLLDYSGDFFFVVVVIVFVILIAIGWERL